VASSRTRIFRSAILVLTGLVAVWHGLPVVVWEVSLRPALEMEPQAARLDVATVRAFPEVPPDWTALAFGEVELRAPLAAASSETCPRAGSHCFLPVEGGTLSITGAGTLESYRTLVDLRAPDQDDLSWWRPSWKNWQTIRALHLRVQTSRSSLDSFRFEHAFAKGVVAHTLRDGRHRFIASTYSPSESANHALGMAGVDHETFMQVLGTLRFRSPK